jgi:hypothetical protein
MYKYFCLFLLFFAFSSCANPSPAVIQVTPGNAADYVAPTYTPRPIPTPLPKNDDGEIVLLMRKRVAPFEVVLLRLSNKCLLHGQVCDTEGNLLGALPQGLSQVQEISWTKDGDRAFFWDGNTADIYILDGNQGTFQLFKREVLKIRENFLVSPNGENTIFEIQKNDYETDLVLMNTLSGDIFKFDLPIVGAKHPSQWIDDNIVLFWNEVSEGKGYLVDLKVYTLNTLDHSAQPFDIGRDWMQTSVPIFSPDRKFMAFTTDNKTIIRDASSSVESVWNVKGEKFLWSGDSDLLAIYDSNRKIYAALPNGGGLQEIHSLSAIGDLEDWMWLPDNQHILLIAVDGDGNRQLGVLSVEEKTFAPINLSLLNEYDPVSFSFRP